MVMGKGFKCNRNKPLGRIFTITQARHLRLFTFKKYDLVHLYCTLIAC